VGGAHQRGVETAALQQRQHVGAGGFPAFALHVVDEPLHLQSRIDHDLRVGKSALEQAHHFLPEIFMSPFQLPPFPGIESQAADQPYRQHDRRRTQGGDHGLHLTRRRVRSL